VSVIDNTSLTNNAPTGVNDNFVMENTGTLNVSLLSNDSDPDGDLLTINTTAVSGPTVGTLTINPNGTFSYEPPTGYVGEVNFQYEVCDNGTPQLCDIVDVMIEV